MEIKSISQKIFRTSPNKVEQNSNQTNPFGVNFKGNIISADVFQSANPNIVAKAKGKVAERGKIWASAMVGSISGISEAISQRLNKVVECGRKMTEGVRKAWNYLNTNNLSLSMDLKIVERTSNAWASIRSDKAYQVNNLLKADMSQIENMFSEVAAARVAAVGA